MGVLELWSPMRDSELRASYTRACLRLSPQTLRGAHVCPLEHDPPYGCVCLDRRRTYVTLLLGRENNTSKPMDVMDEVHLRHPPATTRSTDPHLFLRKRQLARRFRLFELKPGGELLGLRLSLSEHRRGSVHPRLDRIFEAMVLLSKACFALGHLRERGARG